MIVIKLARIYYQILGLLPATTFLGRLLKICKYVLFTLCFSGIIFPSLAFLLNNLDDMAKATHAACCVAAPTLTQYWYFVINQKELFTILERLQE